MGRASKLSEYQWIEVERRHLIDGESINALGAEFGMNESSIRRRIKPNKAEAPGTKKSLLSIAEQKVSADAEIRHIDHVIAELPFAKQRIVSDLASRLTSISESMGSAAQNSAASADLLAKLAKRQLALLNDADPTASGAAIQAYAAYQKLSNIAAEIPTNMLRANKDQIDAQIERDRTATEKKNSEVALRPQLTREEWMVAHGVGTATRSAE